MTVQELIEKLSKVEDKTKDVMYLNITETCWLEPSVDVICEKHDGVYLGYEFPSDFVLTDEAINPDREFVDPLRLE